MTAKRGEFSQPNWLLLFFSTRIEPLITSALEDMSRSRMFRPLFDVLDWLYVAARRGSTRLGFTSKVVQLFLLALFMAPLIWLVGPFLLGKRLIQVLPRRTHVSSAPGSFLQFLADFLCSSKTKQDIADPIIADMQFEYYDALFAHRKAKAGWIRVRGCCAFFHALGLHRILKGVAGLFQQARPR
jgi:hypothetical protein